MVVASGREQRGAAVLGVGLVDVCAGLKEHFDQVGVAMLDGGVEGRDPVGWVRVVEVRSCLH
eukprot:2885760-Pyramimonas_sp.AAC.2